ncbi:MAG: hypothetical protein WBE26_20720 [Phycisphaerae bacterium]
MSNATINPLTTVFHIRVDPSQSASADKMDALLAATSLQVDVCGDVYRGLARLCRSWSDALRAVIVCVDGLGSAELEFFSIASRSCRGVSVHVYGDERSTARITRAVELGAAGRVTEEMIRELAKAAVSAPPKPIRSDAAASATSLKPSAVGVESTETSVREPGRAEVPNQPAAEVPAEPDGLKRTDEEIRRDPVRVPWLRYADTPARTPPRRRQPSPGRARAPEPVKPPSFPREPLLTEAELRALLGDDIASIAPEEPDATGHNERDDAGAPS